MTDDSFNRAMRDQLSPDRDSRSGESKLLHGELFAEHGDNALLRMKWTGYGVALLLVVLTTLAGWELGWQDAKANLMMFYLLGVVFCATRLGRGPAIFGSIVSVVVFDFVFVPPFFTFSLGTDTRYFFSLIVMLIVAVLVSELAARARERAVLAQEKARTAEAQYLLSRDLSVTRDIDELLSVASRHVSEVFRCEVVFLLPKETDGKVVQARSDNTLRLDENELTASQDAFNLKRMVRPKSEEKKSYSSLYVPLTGSQKTVGVVGLLRESDKMQLDPAQMNLLLAFANQTAVALERALLWKASEDANLRAERERMRSSLLSSVSHDLRTPLSSITGAASSMLASFDAMSPDTVKELVQSIYDEADRLNRLVGNLLDMTRLQAGVITVKKDWYSLEEVVGAAITRMERLLKKYKIVTRIPEDLPLIAIDPTLIEQLFINLLDNATKYSEPGNEIRITAKFANRVLSVEVFNTGSELPRGEEGKVFEKFYRGRQTVSGGGVGVGLGLAICQAIVQAHGGRILAENMSGKGVNFLITLPMEGEAPRVEVELEAAEVNK